MQDSKKSSRQARGRTQASKKRRQEESKQERNNASKTAEIMNRHKTVSMKEKKGK